MVVPDIVRKCVGFIGYKNNDGMYIPAGTFFLVGKRQEGTDKVFTYAVTAKHVIDNIRDIRCDEVYLRTNTIEGNARWYATDIANWIFHPDDLEVDVAIHIGSVQGQDQLIYPVDRFATLEVLIKEGIGVGNEIFLAGLFARHHGEQRNIPIIRVGDIAAMPEEPIETRFGQMEGYLIESRSIGGISGSPVFVHLGTDYSTLESGRLGYAYQKFYLLGLMHGHWETVQAGGYLNDEERSKEIVNMGIAIVVPASKILEVIEQPSVKRSDEWRASQA